ncbi:hypothetical protein FHU41_000798 [Psychromicrobium silvestre]|uniref:Glyoxalase-like domain-containing protein n=1 Tax=Psychromicrobium silvestre TaxID=1645614 RepID=A0A7Y9LS50_9MICC|nr:VOC family protein [Psychromicrobium silvestre]NYE94577.1 hypothetical protein [Psychromicrobium silvestre]
MAQSKKPSLRLTSLTIGSSRPRELAAFYARLLSWPIRAEEAAGDGEPEWAGWAQLAPPEGESGPTLNVEYERFYNRPVWPSEPGQQTASQHLDIAVDDLVEAVEWAIRCGATLAQTQPQEGVRVLFDPEGHPFCLFR